MFRHHITYPGMLAKAVATRMEELESGTFSRIAVELVCFDLRIRRRHSISGPIGQHPGGVQEAIDREIVGRYQPFQERSGDHVRELVRQATAKAITDGPPAATLSCEKEFVYFPALHREIIDIRWRELGFDVVSGYLTSLIRYDLLLCGPHKYFHGDDCDAEMLAALDRETLRLFHEHEKEENRPEIFADRIMAEEAGMPLTRDESEKLMLIAAEQLRLRAIASWEARRKG